VPVHHAHEGTVAEEVRQALGGVTQSRPIGTRHAHVRGQLGKTADAAAAAIGGSLHGAESTSANLPLAAREATVSTFAAMDAYDQARALIDAAHGADPTRAADGRAAELVYAERIEAWVARLVPAAPPLLRLAARCQHLERWRVPRASYPLDKTGYHAWRRSLYTKQAERARALLLAAGIPATEAAEVATWVSKTGLKTNAGTQALEDAACLVFLENEISAFAAQHADYPREKFIEILRKTWRKMSPVAQAAARGLALPPGIAALVGEALA
jgi:tRNAThr (cytosine32-N3)-methyltransferase